jgi:hypothetical protein
MAALPVRHLPHIPSRPTSSCPTSSSDPTSFSHPIPQVLPLDCLAPITFHHELIIRTAGPLILLGLVFLVSTLVTSSLAQRHDRHPNLGPWPVPSL